MANSPLTLITPVRAEPRAPDGTPLYVHLPFCAAKCHYCDFFSVAGEGQDTSAMIAAIELEIRARAPRRPATVYIGGGTPTYLDERELTSIFACLETTCDFRSSALEVTVECNPESLTYDKARLLLDLGATRLSIGFQSLDPAVLQLFGRVHRVEQSFAAYRDARRAGARNVNVDLIYAVPGQTAESWARDLGRVLDLGPDHLSAYNLTFEEETLFGRWLEEGAIESAAEEVELELFALTRSTLDARGLEAYEISNFARPGHACAHNIHYWSNGTYVGVGPSAVSKVGFRRSGNVRSLPGYRRSAQQGTRPLAWEEEPDPWLRLMETWWLGLRLRDGVDPSIARTRAGYAGDDAAVAVAEGMVESGHLERDGERYRLSAAGLPLADAIARRFLQAERPRTRT